MRKPHRRERLMPPDDGPDRELDALLEQVDRRLDDGFLAEVQAAFARGDEAEEPTAA